MAQLDLFHPEDRVEAVESRENPAGVFLDRYCAAMRGAERRPRYGGGRPVLASIEVALSRGLWHWGVCVRSADGFGFGFAPARKWRCFAGTLRGAVLDAVHEIRYRIMGRPVNRAVECWLDRVESGMEPLARVSYDDVA